MSHMGKSHLVIMMTVGADDVAEGDRIFASHGELMKGHPREGDVALLGYTVSKAPELSNPMDPNSEPTGKTTFVIDEYYESPHRQALAGHDELAGNVLRRTGVDGQGHGGGTAQRHSCPSTLVRRSKPAFASPARGLCQSWRDEHEARLPPARADLHSRNHLAAPAACRAQSRRSPGGPPVRRSCQTISAT